MKYYLLTFNEDWADEHNVPALNCFTEDQYQNWIQKSHWEDKDKDDSKIYASLGNNGEGFSEQFTEFDTMQDFVDEGIVEVTEVDESFYKIFKKVKLSDLSLCNIFEI